MITTDQTTIPNTINEIPITYKTWDEAIIRVLGDYDKPMKAIELAEIILKKKYYQTTGKTPEMSVNRNLTENYNGYYVSAGNGKHTLSQSGKSKYYEIKGMQPLPKPADSIKSKVDTPTANSAVGEVKYWLYAPGENARFWDECIANGEMYLGWDSMGDLSMYDSKEAMTQRMTVLYGDQSNHMNDALATYDFVHTLKPGDIIFVKKGTRQIIGRGVVTGEYGHQPSRKEYKNVRSVEWQVTGEWGYDEKLVLKTLTDITKYPNFVTQLEALVNCTPKTPLTKKNQTYTLNDFLKDVYMDAAEYNDLKETLELKKNIIIQGAPGVGKTFSAKRLAYSIMGEIDEKRIGFVQFHQNYSYEDFVMGFKPNANGGFDLQHGIFYKFCTKAANDPNREYFFIIDEINRGNLSKIFGELLMLIENNYRGDKITLAYNEEQFAVPKNLYIIGMMNTADRSLAMIDYALRRRFSFYSMKPGFDSNGFKLYQKALNSTKFNHLIEKVKELNKAIVEDDSLGSGFEIGHSYFCNQKSINNAWLRLVVNYDIIPMLEEYWFDNKDRVNSWSQILKNIIND